MVPLEPAQALASLLRDLGTDPRQIPQHPDEAAALLRSALAPTRTLLVLDDAASAAQVRPLLPAGPGCAVVVTSRTPLAALDGAARFPLDRLSREESVALLAAVCGQGRVTADSDAATRLVGLCGQLPLALRIVAARLAARRALTTEALADLLTAEAGRLDHLEYDDLSVRRSLAVAHEALLASDRDADRDAALALRRTGALDLPEYEAPVIARLMDTDERRAAAALDRLAEVALLEEIAYGRYAPHDLVRDFARELAGREPEPERTQAVERALCWYAAAARETVLALLPPGRERENRLPPAVAEATPFASIEEAFAWGDRELPNAVALVERYARTCRPALLIVRALFPYLHRRGRLREFQTLNELALDAARSRGDLEAEAHALSDLAALHFMCGRIEQSLALNDEAIALWRRLGRTSRTQRGLGNRGMLLERLGRTEEAVAVLRESLELAEQQQDLYGIAIIFGHLGNLYEHTDARLAIEYHTRSLEAGDGIDDFRLIRETAHCNLGYAHLRLGEPALALPHFEESLRVLAQGDNDWHSQSQSRLGLIRTLHALGRPAEARRECESLLHRAGSRGDNYTSGLTRHLYGQLLTGEEAAAQWRAALRDLDGTDTPVRDELERLLATAAAAPRQSSVTSRRRSTPPPPS
ncbi:tetratricopeptide repeat protein [Streptomyces sp. GC420]|uniref:tetratricopeptide repeat protein n=1 Tax=Streptomyces sp. GC420 TaxID=2697568 RepID=UPI0037D9D303